MLAAMVLSAPAQADNYGGNTRAEQQQMKRLIYQTFGTGWVGRTMVCIAGRESGLNPRAANYRDANGGSYGLFQINGAHARGGVTQSWIRSMWNPVVNIRSARALFNSDRRAGGNGLGPWNGGC